MEGGWSTRMGSALAEAGLDVHDLPPLEQLSAGQKQKVMRTFTGALGIPCLGCHPEESSAADTRRAKRMYSEIVRPLASRDGEPTRRIGYWRASPPGPARVLAEPQDEGAETAVAAPVIVADAAPPTCGTKAAPCPMQRFSCTRRWHRRTRQTR